MELTLIVVLVAATIIWAWMTLLGVLAAKYDQTLEPFQKKAQIIISLCIPYFGAALVLHLVNQHSPDAIPKKLVPWPLKSLVFGQARSRNRNRDNREKWGVPHHRHDIGGDGGGGD